MSIDAKELMIGNWVYEDSKINGEILQEAAPVQVDVKLLYDLVTKNTGTYNYEPIPLTPDILIDKCGFEREDMADLGIRIYIPVSEGYCLSWYNGSIWLEEMNTEAIYLHQLQNLYYSLSQNHLTINL
jgi:hypothetical protein